VRWQAFKNFSHDMLPSYKKGLMLERINNNGHYKVSNCRWATPREQARNRRTNHKIKTPLGLMCVSEAAWVYGIRIPTLHSRIRKGVPTKHLLDPVKGAS
jgi:hypothetical protein